MEYLNRPVVAIFDKKTGLFESLGACKHVGEVIREFDLLSKNKQTKFGMHPEDFDLREVGTFNEYSGELKTINPPRILTTGVNNASDVQAQ